MSNGENMEGIFLYNIREFVNEQIEGPFSSEKNRKFYFFKEYLFKHIGLDINYESYNNEFSIIQMEINKIKDDFSGKILHGEQEKNIIFDNELNNICSSYFSGFLGCFRNAPDLFTINSNEDIFREVNRYMNRDNQLCVKLVLCCKENSKINFYGYCLKDITKLNNLLGYNEVVEEDYNLFKIHPLLECLFIEVIKSWYEDTIPDTEKNRSNHVKHIITEAMEILFSKLGLPDLDCINVISSLTYESSKCHSSLTFDSCGTEAVNADTVVNFIKSVNFEVEECRKIRKYLQMAQGDMQLVASSGFWPQIKGIANKNEKMCNLEILFKGHMKWQLAVSGKSIVEYENGQYKFIFSKDKEKIYINRFKNYLQCNENDENCKKLYEILCKAEEQNHGTLLIISNKAKEVAKYYCERGRGIEIEPIDLYEKRDTIYNLTTIDGALIMDESGICYALGVILDGKACMYSNTGRGARYNSAYTFIANKIEFDSEDSRWIAEDERYIAVIISEDKTVDFITNTDIYTPFLQYQEDLLNSMRDYDDGMEMLY